MGSYHWIKLYHDLLDDPKMQLLPDRLWRRAVELMLVAGKTRRDTHWGRLPPVEEVAWFLRIEPASLEADLIELESRTRVVENRGGRWFVVNFADRQEPMSASDRGKRHRDRQRYLEQTLTERETNESFAEERREEDAARG